MAQSLYYIDFKTLRHVHNEIRSFLQEWSFVKVESVNDRICNDLGCAGDDAYDLLSKFVTQYKLDTKGFDFSKHFLSEGELFGNYGWFVFFITLPIWVVYFILKLVTLNKVRIKRPELYSIFYRDTTDMTFGDLITWYVTGKYNTRQEVKLVLKCW